MLFGILCQAKMLEIVVLIRGFLWKKNGFKAVFM